MAFGIDLNAVVDRAAAKAGPLLDQAIAKLQPMLQQAIGTAAAATTTLDASIDALTAEQVKTNALLRAILAELRREHAVKARPAG